MLWYGEWVGVMGYQDLSEGYHARCRVRLTSRLGNEENQGYPASGIDLRGSLALHNERTRGVVIEGRKLVARWVHIWNVRLNCIWHTEQQISSRSRGTRDKLWLEEWLLVEGADAVQVGAPDLRLLNVVLTKLCSPGEYSVSKGGGRMEAFEIRLPTADMGETGGEFVMLFL